MDYETLAEDLQGRDHAKIANNTYAHRRDPETITVTLHGNTILIYGSDGSIDASDAGWPTLTTVQRLNAFTPERYLFTRRGNVVYVLDRTGDDVVSTPLSEQEGVLCEAGMSRFDLVILLVVVAALAYFLGAVVAWVR